jgi:protein SCO1/2
MRGVLIARGRDRDAGEDRGHECAIGHSLGSPPVQPEVPVWPVGGGCALAGTLANTRSSYRWGGPTIGCRAGRRTWPSMRGHVRRLMVPTIAALACAAIAACGSSQTQTGPNASLFDLDGKLRAPAQLTAATPQFALRDSTGKLVRLSQFRGKAVLLTFIYDHCPDTCPLIVGDLHTALLKLGSAASRLEIIAVSVDPTGDTPATVRRFLAAHEMTGRMEYLIGSLTELAPVWKAYGVEVQGSPETREVGHSAFLYGITGSGAVLAVYPPTFDPAWIAHDAPLLASR